MVNFSDEALASIKELESDASDVSFIVLGFGEDFGKTLNVEHKGPGGVAEVKDKLAAYEDKVAVGAFKITGIDDRGSTVSVRRKYVHFIWVGPKVAVMKKAKVGTMSADFKSKFEGMSIYLQAFDFDSFSEEDLEKQLRASGGAHQPTKYDFTNSYKHEASANGRAAEEAAS